MISSPPENDDKCQILTCNEAHYTYCPHCKLYVCIKHLNEHHANYEQEYQSLMEEYKIEESTNEELLAAIKNGKNQLMKFFDDHIQWCQDLKEYTIGKKSQSNIRPHDCADLRSHIAQSSQKRIKLQTFIEDIKRLIEHYNAEQSKSLIDYTSSAADSTTKELSVSKRFSTDYIKIEDDDVPNGSDELIDRSESFLNNQFNWEEESTVNETNVHNGYIIVASAFPELEEIVENDHSSSSPKVQEKFDKKQNNSIAKSRIKAFRVQTCPLIDKQYGIDLNRHPIHSVPCSRRHIGNISLYTHLRLFHCLNPKASVRIIRYMMENGCDGDHDLFSHEISGLMDILPRSYRSRCPLTELGIFGLNQFHNLRLCTEDTTNDRTVLLNHLMIYHYLSYSWARKVCAAVQAHYDPKKHILFKPNEPIKTKRRTKRTKRKTNCDKSSPDKEVM